MSDYEHAFVFVDNHDNQRGHGAGGQVLTHEDPELYRYAQGSIDSVPTYHHITTYLVCIHLDLPLVSRVSKVL